MVYIQQESFFVLALFCLFEMLCCNMQKSSPNRLQKFQKPYIFHQQIKKKIPVHERTFISINISFFLSFQIAEIPGQKESDPGWEISTLYSHLTQTERIILRSYQSPLTSFSSLFKEGLLLNDIYCHQRIMQGNFTTEVKPKGRQRCASQMSLLTESLSPNVIIIVNRT